MPLKFTQQDKKLFLKNVKRCTDHYAKKHSNKVLAWQYAIMAGMMAYKTLGAYEQQKAAKERPT